MSHKAVVAIMITALGFGILAASACSRGGVTEGRPPAPAPWPTPIPCRIQNGANPDLFLMALGEVGTPLADGRFDPARDLVTLADGREIPNYFKDELGVKYFRPLDKSVFPLPPSGWCSWYYYYQEVSEKVIEKNAAWLAANLKDYGAVYCQIDDGWQGRGHGSNDNRDWTTIDKRFPMGMAALAQTIRNLGLKPGIWLAPHGQSNADVVKRWNAFLLGRDGRSASSTWEGDYLLDPSRPEALAYLRDLFKTLAESWGYDYFKIDGQPIVVEEYKAKLALMKNPARDPEALYRRTLETIREAIGPGRYLLGCWGVPLEGVGLFNGSRTGGDVVLGWDGFWVALDATMNYYFLHNIAWYSDPDTMLLRYPLTLDQARVWATLQGLTGQALFSSDALPDLPDERVELLRRVFPAVDIRPIDLFPAGRNKKIWDLKVSHLGRSYDVVGCFNFDETKTAGVELLWKDLGLDKDAPVHVFDFWNREYLGCWDKGFYVPLAPSSVRVLTLLADRPEPQLISTSRHISQGWVDLVECGYNAEEMAFSGESRIVRDDPYELRFVFPRGGPGFRILSADARAEEVTFKNHGRWATVTIRHPISAVVPWKVRFEPAVYYDFPVRAPSGLRADIKGLNRVALSWDSNYYLNAGYAVSVDGAQRFITPVNRCEISLPDPGAEYEIKVATAWQDGTVSPKTASVKIRPLDAAAREVFLSELDPASASCGWGVPQNDRAISGAPLRIGSTTYPKGIGTHAVSEIVYNLFGLFGSFESAVGIDAASDGDKGSVMFEVYADGKLLWTSGLMKKSTGAKTLMLDVRGVKELRLRVGDGGDGIDYDHADWAAARLLR
jgi:hypothetical protein